MSEWILTMTFDKNREEHKIVLAWIKETAEYHATKKCDEKRVSFIGALQETDRHRAIGSFCSKPIDI